MIITYDQEETITLKDLEIDVEVVPIYKYLWTEASLDKEMFLLIEGGCVISHDTPSFVCRA